MRIVLDTNVLLVSFSDKSKFHKIIQNLTLGNFVLLLSNDIFFEYYEVILRYYGEAVSLRFLEFIFNINFVEYISIYYKLNLISPDPDDNKFVDCAFAGNADYLVTDDSHFQELKKIDFPKINIISTEDFLKLLSEN
ncbi:MAG: putative toxin-antitoxin system toxin component, PIN family [Ignavibacteria bacterium]|nr:putative toxin-antitoxin system toxin component, PIN family [Ignavibacteria bacterium]